MNFSQLSLLLWVIDEINLWFREKIGTHFNRRLKLRSLIGAFFDFLLILFSVGQFYHIMTTTRHSCNGCHRTIIITCGTLNDWRWNICWSLIHADSFDRLVIRIILSLSFDWSIMCDKINVKQFQWIMTNQNYKNVSK